MDYRDRYIFICDFDYNIFWSFSAIALDEYAYFNALPVFNKHGKIEVKEIAYLDNYHVGFGVLDQKNPFFLMQKEFNKYSQEDLGFTQVRKIFLEVLKNRK